MLRRFWNDECGVILSAELVLVGTILILGMIVGLVELQSAVVAELSDLGDAVGNVDQSYRIPGITSFKNSGGVKAQTVGAAFHDRPDAGDCNAIISCDNAVSGGEKSGLSRGAGGPFSSRGIHGPPPEFQHGNRLFGDRIHPDVASDHLGNDHHPGPPHRANQEMRNGGFGKGQRRQRDIERPDERERHDEHERRDDIRHRDRDADDDANIPERRMHKPN